MEISNSIRIKYPVAEPELKQMQIVENSRICYDEIVGNPESRAAYPLFGRGYPPDVRKEGVANGYIF